MFDNVNALSLVDIANDNHSHQKLRLRLSNIVNQPTD